MTRHMRVRYPLRKLAEGIEETLRRGEEVSTQAYKDLDMISLAQKKLEGCIAALYLEWLKLQEMKERRKDEGEVEMNTDAWEAFVEFNSCPRGGCNA